MTADPDLTNVTKFPLKPKARPEEHQDLFLVVEEGGCQHTSGFTLNEKEDQVVCKKCGTRLNPMHALKLLAREETQWHQTRALYREEMKRLDERRKTTCEHCNKITSISKPRR